MNLLIVDDDERVVDNIVETLPWDKMGIDRVLTAGNVSRAMEILKAYSVQILLTDVEMSQGSGLELLEWVRENALPIKCVILSSYAKFSYAQKAIELDVCEYMLKPVKYRDLEHAISRIAATVPAVWEDKKQEIYNKMLKEPNSFSRYLQIGKEEKLIALLTEHVFLVIVRILPAKTDGNRARENEIMDFVVRNVVKEFLAGKGCEPEAIVQGSDTDWYLVLKSREIDRKGLCELKDCFKSSICPDTFVYVSRAFPIQDLGRCREELDDAAAKYLTGSDNILFWGDGRKDGGDLLPPWEEWGKNAYGAGAPEYAANGIKDYLRNASDGYLLTVDWMREFRKKLIWLVFQLLERSSMHFHHIYGGAEYDFLYDASVSSIGSMIGFVDWLFLRLDKGHENSGEKEGLAESIKEYVREHFSENLSRKEIADVFYLSEDYIGKVFISATGKSISAYVAEQRLKAAEEYLTQTSLSVSQIAMKVGYNNFSYFSKSFKDYTGLTPNEYRANNRLKCRQMYGE